MAAHVPTLEIRMEQKAKRVNYMKKKKSQKKFVKLLFDFAILEADKSV